MYDEHLAGHAININPCWLLTAPPRKAQNPKHSLAFDDIPRH